MAIKTKPKAKLPITKCQYQGTLNIGLVSDPTILRILVIKIIPINVPNIIRYEATLVINKIIAETAISNTEVSPTDPGIKPKKASDQLKLASKPLVPDSAA